MTRGDCPICEGDGFVGKNFALRSPGYPAIVRCPDCGGTGLSAQSFDAFHEETDALSRAALAPWPPEPCGRLLVGRGSDTYDPLCQRPRGHSGLCSPSPDAVAPEDAA